MIDDDELTRAIVRVLKSHSGLALSRVQDRLWLDHGVQATVPSIGLRLARLATQGRARCDGMVWRSAD